MTSLSTKDYSQALLWSKENSAFFEVFQTYCPQDNFHEAISDGSSFSFSITESNSQIYFMGLGPHPHIPQAWTNCSVSRQSDIQWSDAVVHEGDWDFYSIETGNFFQENEIASLEDEVEIRDFLKLHAPESSVFPGDKEILFWSGIRSDNQKLVAAGVAVRWRSGRVMLASISTHTDHRGKGIAQKLVTSMLGRLNSLGIENVGLGVRAENTWARKAYESIGFSLVARFSAYAKA